MQELRTYQVLNDWQELDEEELSDNAQELMSNYGPFSVMLYGRLKKVKLFDVPEEPSVFLKSLIRFFTKNAKEIMKSKESYENIKKLVSLFPSPKEFKDILGFHQLRGKERVFLKVALDIMIFYYEMTELPLFEKLQKDIIPLALNFYKLLTPQALKEITNELSPFSSSSYLNNQ